MDEVFPRTVPLAGDRVRCAAVIGAHVPPHAVAAALLAVLRKHSGQHGFEIDVAGRGALRVAMPAGRTLAEHARGVAEAIDGVAGEPEGSGVVFAICAPPADARAYDLVVVADAGTVHVDGPNGDRILRHTLRVLEQVLGAPGRTLAEVDLLDPGERDQVRLEFNATARDYPRDNAIYPLFAQRVAAAPDRVAVVHGDSTLTYRELDERAATLAAALSARGVGPGDRVALLFGKVPDWIVATLAVLRSGAAYVPIDPDFPPERRDFVLADSGARLLIAAEAVADAPLEVIGPRETAAGPVPVAEVDAADGAYVMYTSGTTGRPKGVLINQRAVVRLVRGSQFATLEPGTRILQTGAVGFDATTFEIWGALLNGGALILVPQETILDATALRRTIERHGISTMWLTAPLFHQLVDQDATVFRSVREVLAGGDVLSPRHIATAMQTCPGLVVINGYGPTENTTFSTTHRLAEPPSGRIPIGTPVANSTAYIVDLDDRLLPVGVAGELLVGGDGLSDGYLNRPDLESLRFTPNPFGTGRLYRTGDLAAWRPDGTIDFLGRVDQQVKIRGFRVEPGELEHRLVELPVIREAAVLARTRPDGIERYLCAFVTADRPLAPGEVQVALRDRLPDYLVPSVVVQVDAMPLNRNGKVDRDALETLSVEAAAAPSGGIAPRDEVEAALAELWREALGVAAIGVTDNIFDLGVTSLTAAVFAGRARQRFGPWLTAAEVLSRPTIESLARLISGAGDSTAAPPRLVVAPHRAFYPLTPQQRAVHVEQAKDLAGTHYNIPVLIRTAEPIDRARLQAALELLVERHESLRTTFVPVGGTTYQRIRDDIRVVIDDLPADSPEALRGYVRPFDLVEGPLLRAGLHQGLGYTVVLLDLHHLVADGISVGVLLDELATTYAGGALDRVAGQYRDYAVWRADAGERWIEQRQGAFWAEALAGLAERPDLPTDFPRPPLRALDGARLEFDFGAARSEALRELARRHGVTAFHALLAVHFLLMVEVTGVEDVTTGVPVGGRSVPGTERIVGMFANTLCLRARLDLAQSFTAFLRQVGDHTLGALRNADLSFDRLVEARARDYSRNPLFDAMIGFQDAATYTGRTILGGSATAADTLNRHTMFDLNLQVYDDGGDWCGVWAYSTALFRAETVHTFARRLLDLIDTIATGPTRPVGDLIGRNRPTTGAAVINFDFATANNS